MNKFVYVEFLLSAGSINMYEDIVDLGDDFVQIAGSISNNEYHPYQRVVGKINAETATALMLSNSSLSKNMRVSYISSEFKDRYRK
jgi:hypothetical protein